jgi:hypothetical protein
MKKVFTLTIVSLMISLAVLNSCSKSSDSSTTTPTPTQTTNDTNVTIDGVKMHLNPIGCQLSGGSSNIFTMASITDDGNTTVQGNTYGTPTAGTYTVSISNITSASAGKIQLLLLIGPSGSQTQYVATGGTATITTGTPPAASIKVSFSGLTFNHGSTNKVASGTIYCQ